MAWLSSLLSISVRLHTPDDTTIKDKTYKGEKNSKDHFSFVPWQPNHIELNEPGFVRLDKLK